MGRSKRHHYIAESFQERFCTTPNSLWYAERNGAEQYKLERRSPFGCFWVRNLNTILVDDTPSDLLEKQFWGAVDQDVNDLLQDVDATFDSGNAPHIEGKALQDFKKLFAVVARRSPDATNMPGSTEVGDQYHEMLRDFFLESGHKLRPKHSDQIWLKQSGRAILAKAKASFPELVFEALNDYSVRWVVPEGNASFVLGSKSVYRAHGKSGSGHLNDPLTELYWPVSPKLALVLIRLPYRDFPLVTILPQQKVRSWNEAICKESVAIASHSKRLLVSLLAGRLEKRPEQS